MLNCIVLICDWNWTNEIKLTKPTLMTMLYDIVNYKKNIKIINIIFDNIMIYLIFNYLCSIKHLLTKYSNIIILKFYHCYYEFCFIFLVVSLNLFFICNKFQSK